MIVIPIMITSNENRNNEDDDVIGNSLGVDKDIDVEIENDIDVENENDIEIRMTSDDSIVTFKPVNNAKDKKR